MTTIISGSNRLGNVTHLVSEHYYAMMHEKDPGTRLLSLEDLPIGFLYPDMYKSKHPDFIQMEKEFMIPAEKFVFVVPEYNGSFPGVLKAFIDACEIKTCFHGKKAALVGLGSGSSGNQRGLDHLTAILHHMKVNVLPSRVYLSHVDDHFNAESKLHDQRTIRNMEKQIGDFIAF